MNRRELLAGAAWTAVSMARVKGANDRVRLGLIGCGERGQYVAGFMQKAPGAQFISFCDVYRTNALAAREKLNREGTIHNDMRELVARGDIDAVLIATPDHWHANAAVIACRAGKDVYVEKPISYSIREGRAMAQAAAKSGRIVQAGTQQRSAPHLAECAEMVRSGALGEVHLVRVWNYMSLFPVGLGRPADGPAPEGLDWDRYLGPAPQRPFNSARFLSSYRWFWDYAGGLITDFGTHRFDTVHQIMGEEKPRTVAACGRRFAMRDIGEMPDTLQVTYEYPSFVMSYECSTLNSFGTGNRTPGQKYYHARTAFDRPHGMAFYGTNGTLVADRIGYEVFPEPVDEELNGAAPPTAYRTERKVVQARDAIATHAVNFIENVRARKTPAATIETGHRATSVGLLGNIAFKTGLKLRWNAETEDFENQPEASALLWREPREGYNWMSARG